MLSRSIMLMNSKGKSIVEPIEPIPILFENYLLSIDDMLVKLEDGKLYLSEDNGETYNDGLAIDGVGAIKMIHVFKDGELLLCDAKKTYYSYDWETLNESTVIDINGNPYVPVVFDNFSSPITTGRQIVDGVEVKCWGNYSIVSGVAFDNINVWYTADQGKTIKSAIKFGTSGNGPISERVSRHVHAVDFNPDDSTFWVQTGDWDDDPHLIKGLYDLQADAWDWEIVGYGQNFKFGNMMFYEGYAYWSWDVAPNGGVMRCKYEDIADVSKHERLFTTPNDCMNIFIGDRGDMLVTIIKWGGREKAHMLYYSPDRINFHAFLGDIPEGYSDGTMYWRMFAPNSKGKILSGVWDDSQVGWNGWNGLPSVWLDDIIKNAGFPNAFKPL